MTDTGEQRAVVVYTRGPEWADGVALGEQDGAREHIAFLVAGYGAGVVELAGPFHRLEDEVPDGALVGLVVYRCDAAVASSRTQEDPAVRSGLLEFHVLPWYA